MTTNNESQCYFVQLQFDSYIDGDLSETRQESFLNHVRDCADCAREFRYAQTVQDALLDMPLLDCSDAAMDKVHEITTSVPDQQQGDDWWRGVLAWIAATPVVLRYAFPATAVVIIGVIALTQFQSPPGDAPLLVSELLMPTTTPVEYSPQEILEALDELNTAIEYLNEVSRRTESLVGGRFVMQPLMQPLRVRLDASFERMLGC